MPRRPKRRAYGDGSTHQDKHGVWWAQLVLPTGKTARRRAKSEAEAKEKLAVLKDEHKQGVDLSKRQPTVSEWCAIWLDQFADELRPSVRDSYSSIIRRHIDTAAIGRRRLDKVTPAEVQAWLKDVANGRTYNTVRNARAVLRRALNVAIKQQYLSSNPAINSAIPTKYTAESRDEIRPLDFEQAATLLASVELHRWHALYRLALNLGLRLAELTGLTWDCIDFRAKTLTVRQQLKRVPKAEGGRAFGLQIPKTKSGIRTLSLDDDLIAVLRAHRANQAEEALLLGDAYKDPYVAKRGGLLFVSDTGAPLHNSNVFNHFRRVLKRAELPQIRFHDLRHTAATLMLASGAQLVTVSKVLGHSSPAITAKIYAHALDEQKASAIASLSARLRQKVQ
jgi:integrase